jgi:hypothetical protein
MSVFSVPAMAETAYFEMSFSPNVALVSTVRRFVMDFYAQLLSDPETTSRLAVSTHELLENAVRYSFDGKTDVRVGLSRDDCTVTIDTRNRADPANIVAMRRAIDELSGAPDPSAYYQSLMRRNAKRTDGSGLGLARVWAESEMPVTYRVDGDHVFLRAVARLEGKKQ